MRKLLISMLFCAVIAYGQVSNQAIVKVSNAPSGACPSGVNGQLVIPTGAIWTCQNIVAGIGTWAAVSGGGGGITPPAGDIGGTTASPTIAEIQGTPVTITPSWAVGDVLCYDGVALTPCPPSAGNPVLVYASNTSSDISTYDVMATTPVGVQYTLPVSIPATTTKTLIQAFATASGTPNVTLIPAGEWHADTYIQVSSASNTTTLQIDVYDRTAGGVETLLFSFGNQTISGNGTGIQAASADSVQPAFSVGATDRIVVKYSATKTGGSGITATLYGGGATNYTHLHTPLGTGTNPFPGCTPDGSNGIQCTGALAAVAMVVGGGPKTIAQLLALTDVSATQTFDVKDSADCATQTVGKAVSCMCETDNGSGTCTLWAAMGGGTTYTLPAAGASLGGTKSGACSTGNHADGTYNTDGTPHCSPDTAGVAVDWPSVPTTVNSQTTATVNNDVTETVTGCATGKKFYSSCQGTSCTLASPTAYSTGVSVVPDSSTKASFSSLCAPYDPSTLAFLGYQAAAPVRSNLTFVVADPTGAASGATPSTDLTTNPSASACSSCITLADAGTTGSAVYYNETTDGSTPADPTTGSTLYSGALSCAASTTCKFKWIGTKSNYASSNIKAGSLTVTASGYSYNFPGSSLDGNWTIYGTGAAFTISGNAAAGNNGTWGDSFASYTGGTFNPSQYVQGTIGGLTQYGHDAGISCLMTGATSGYTLSWSNNSGSPNMRLNIWTGGSVATYLFQTGTFSVGDAWKLSCVPGSGNTVIHVYQNGTEISGSPFTDSIYHLATGYPGIITIGNDSGTTVKTWSAGNN